MANFASISPSIFFNSSAGRYRPLTITPAIFRTFPIQGRVRLQFRAEGFAILNQPQWSNPNGSVTSGSFMRISSTRGDATTGGGARYVRFGMRVEF